MFTLQNLARKGDWTKWSTFSRRDFQKHFLRKIIVFWSTTSTLVPKSTPDSKAHGANMEPPWGRQDPGGAHVGHMNFAIWDTIQ